MLKITIPYTELFNEETNEFTYIKEQTITLEHSLVSLHKWEKKWGIPFLGKGDKTDEQVIDYIRCMTITPNVDDNAYYALTPEQVNTISEYIDSPMTATWFSDRVRQHKNGGRETITAEIIYYWMLSFGIWYECRKWHLNQLLTLIRVCNEKNSPSKKMSRKEILKDNTALNAQRRAKLKTKG